MSFSYGILGFLIYQPILSESIVYYFDMMKINLCNRNYIQ